MLSSCLLWIFFIIFLSRLKKIFAVLSFDLQEVPVCTKQLLCFTHKRAIKTAKLDFWLQITPYLAKFYVEGCKTLFSTLWYFFQFFWIIFRKVIPLFLRQLHESPVLHKEIQKWQWQPRSEKTKENRFFAVNSEFSKRHTRFYNFIRWAGRFCIVWCIMRNIFGAERRNKKIFSTFIHNGGFQKNW